MFAQIVFVSAALLAGVIVTVLLIVLRRERKRAKPAPAAPRRYVETGADKTMVISREEVDAMLKERQART